VLALDWGFQWKEIEFLGIDFSKELRERGMNLSMGEKQSIAIGRSYCVNPSLWILDEATANMDTGLEKKLMDSLSKFASGKTVLMIAHRLSTVLHADRIVVLENGRVVESGTHDDLLTNSGLYSRLHSLQFIDRDDAGISNEP
jgi:ABC-type multidrug transport system fused ATPase/permease subunit